MAGLEQHVKAETRSSIKYTEQGGSRAHAQTLVVRVGVCFSFPGTGLGSRLVTKPDGSPSTLRCIEPGLASDRQTFLIMRSFEGHRYENHSKTRSIAPKAALTCGKRSHNF